MTTEEYIDHEVRLRVQASEFKRMEAKLNFIITLGIGGILMPVLLHWFKLI